MLFSFPEPDAVCVRLWKDRNPILRNPAPARQRDRRSRGRSRSMELNGGAHRPRRGPGRAPSCTVTPRWARCDGHDRPWTAPGALPAPLGVETPASGRAGNTKPDIVVPVSGFVPVAIRGTKVPRFVVPRAAPQHTVVRGRSGSRTSPAVPPDGPEVVARRGRRARREEVRAAGAWCWRAAHAL